MNGMRRHPLSTVLRGGPAISALGTCGVASAGSAAADATDDYPIPHRTMVTTCTAEQILAAARHFEPIYYERSVTDEHNRPLDGQQAAIDRARWFYPLTPDQRRAYSEEIATNIYGESMAQRWGIWAKIFVNNKGVAAKETDHCTDYPSGDMSVWDG
jgi:hypothetical protein